MLSSSFILSKPFFNGLFDEEVNTSLTAAVTCLFMLALALSGSYSNAEKIGLTVGSLQVVFFILMFAARPSLSEILEDSVQFPITDGEFGNLVTANIGAVIMPWMLAYQQSACALERNSVEELQDRRFETKIGSFITQGVGRDIRSYFLWSRQ